MNKTISMLMILLCAQFAWADVIEIEAEDAKVDAANIVEIEAASGGKVVAFEKKAKNAKIEFTFEVPADGKYQFWAIAGAAVGNGDSFYFKLDDSKQRETWDVKWNKNKDLIKQPIRSRVSTENGKYKGVAYLTELTKGEHKLLISRREPGAQLDKIFIAPADVKMDTKK